MKKTASVRDVIVICILLFSLGFVFFLGKFVGDIIITKMQAVPMVHNNRDAMDVLNSVKGTTSKFDGVSVAVLIGLTIGIIITSYLVPAEPIFAAVWVFVTALAICLMMYLSNMWYGMTNMAEFGTLISSFPKTNFIMLHLPYIALAEGVIGMIALYAKPRGPV